MFQESLNLPDFGDKMRGLNNIYKPSELLGGKLNPEFLLSLSVGLKASGNPTGEK